MVEGRVTTRIDDGIGTVSFFHPQKNSLPGDVLARIADGIAELGEHDDVRVVVLRSEGDGPFCAGASFDELGAITDVEGGTEFFMGFARVILAIRSCPSFVVGRVQGKAVGGGVGLAAACDHTIAADGASIKLSELALGFGPFVIGPVVERKIGRAAFTAMTIDTDWRDAAWAERHGLYTQVTPDLATLDEAVEGLAIRLAGSNPDAVRALKAIFWTGTDNWHTLLHERARQSGSLALSRHTQNALEALRGR
jgi:methylglutaconyl-CoA hydratase